jgi:hypothetical protein
MKSILSILTAFILFAFSFTFSSCKNCNGNKGEDNSVIDTDKDKDQNQDTDTDENNPNNASDIKNPESNDPIIPNNASDIKNPESNDPIIRREKEIRKEIERETIDDYGYKLRRITDGMGHFWYKSEDDSYIDGDCGIFAVLRRLHHAELLDTRYKGLWKRYSNQELRDIIVELGWDKKRGRQGVGLITFELYALMEHIGGPGSYQTKERYGHTLPMEDDGEKEMKLIDIKLRKQ